MCFHLGVELRLQLMNAIEQALQVPLAFRTEAGYGRRRGWLLRRDLEGNDESDENRQQSARLVHDPVARRTLHNRNGVISTVTRLRLLLALGALCLTAVVAGADGGNLLRNGDIQDDWITLLPENLTLHWSYSPAFTNRRDFNPDGWTSKGSWRWIDADQPAGRRRFVVEAPAAEVRQRVNWVAVNDEHKLEGFPDAGGFPSFAAVSSERPLALVRDLVFRVRQGQ
jgi:hypothetical protein